MRGGAMDRKGKRSRIAGFFPHKNQGGAAGKKLAKPPCQPPLTFPR